MLIILNNKLSNKKKFFIALTKIYGINYNYSINLSQRLGITHLANVSNLSLALVKKISKAINKECIIDKELKAHFSINIQSKVKLKTYQGRRHLQGLPVNGQNTKNNSKTAKKLLR
jgi:small subunit ribosomal protein S13